MEAIRRMIHLDTNRLTLDLPKKFCGKTVEVIVLPSPEAPPPTAAPHASPRLARCAGAWCGEQLLRDDQGEYEPREGLR